MTVLAIVGKFAAEKCTIGEEKFWFSHSTAKNSQQFEYNFCEKTFENLVDTMKHKKESHITQVQPCRDDLKGCCKW